MSISVETIPLTEPILPHKQSAKRHWGSHPYFTKRAWNVVQAYIDYYTKPGDTVLDPFGGGGVTFIESLVLRRRAVHLDISPLSTFITQHIAESPVNLDQLTQAFHTVSQQCANPIQSLYRIDDAAITTMPIPGWYPTQPLPINADVDTVDQLFTRRNLIALVLLHQAIAAIPDPLARGLLEFTFSSTLNKVNRTFSHPPQRKASRGDSGIMRHYRYWVPAHPAELPVWEQFAQRFHHVCQAKAETNRLIGDFWNPETGRIIQGSATRLRDLLPQHSVDYIFTDPPYGAHIAYLDLATMWTAWLGLPVTAADRQDEMIVGGDLHKSIDHYAQQLLVMFQQCHAVLKPHHPLTIVFAHKDLRYWAYLMDAALTAGFTYIAAVPQTSYQTSWHKRTHPTSVLTGEVLVTFVQSPTPSHRMAPPPSREQFIGGLLHHIAQVLQHDGGFASHDTIMTAVVQWMLDRQWAPWIATWDIDWIAALHTAFHWDEKTHHWSLVS